MVNDPKGVLDHDLCFRNAGALCGFAAAARCPDEDREWIEQAAEQLLWLSQAYWPANETESGRRRTG